MKKKHYVLLFVMISFIICCVLPIDYEKKEYNFNFDKTTIKEIDISNLKASGIREQFDLESIMTGDNHKFNILFFSGKIIDIKSYEVLWVDENNETWGPFLRNIISIQPIEIFAGDTQKKDVIRILSTEPFYNTDTNSIRINVGEDYVFLNCWTLDDRYFNQITQQEENKQIYDSSLKMADAIIGGAWNSIFPVLNSHVLVYHEYLLSIEDVEKYKLTESNLGFDKFVVNEEFIDNDYIVVSISDLKKSISRLLNTDK